MKITSYPLTPKQIEGLTLTPRGAARLAAIAQAARENYERKQRNRRRIRIALPLLLALSALSWWLLR